MVRKAGNSTQRVAPPPAANGNPPPSTIAAQIVNNATNVKARQETGSKVAFAQLLKEFLNDPSTDEPSSQLNAQLISVIAEAGLDALLKDDPFALGHLIEQGLDSIAAIKLSIQRRPHLLLNARTGDDDEVPQPPLLLWLFPKLLGLLDQPHLGSIHRDVQDLLITFISVLSRTTSLCRQAMSVLNLYRSCIDSILVALEATNQLSQILRPSFKVVLPPTSGIGNFWPESQTVVALPQGFQRIVTSQSRAVILAFRLLQITLDSTNSNRHQSLIASTIGDYIPWALDSCVTLWHSSRQCTALVKRDHVHKGFEAGYIQVLSIISLHIMTPEDDLSHCPKVILSFCTLLSELVQSCSLDPLTSSNQLQLALLLTRLRGFLQDRYHSSHVKGRRLQDMRPIIVECLQPTIISVCCNVAERRPLERDLKLALCLWTSSGDWPDEITVLRNALCSDTAQSFSDGVLLEESVSIVKIFRDLNLVDEENLERPSKRQKVLSSSGESSSRASYKELVMALNGSSQDSPVLDLNGLHNSMKERYSNGLSEGEQSTLLSAFGKIACAGSSCLKPVSIGNTQKNHWTELTCTVCDASSTSQRDEKSYWNKRDHGEDWKDAIAAMLTITEMDNFQDASKPRILMALAIRRLFNHISDADYLNLEISSLGQWLLKSLSRSLRELRIAAARSLMTFLRDDIPKSIRGKNRMQTLGLLHEISKREVLSEQETLIMAYGQAARACGEDELPIILLQLVEYLGHTNALICGMAYNELASIAESFTITPMELLRPFWRSIGFAVIKDIYNKPQKAQQLSDLTEQSVNSLLLSTHTDTLPHLVLTKRKDILERIATARGTTIQDVCTQPRRNLAGILALLLCQPVPDVEKSTLDALVAVAPAFRENGNDLSSWIKLEPVMVACEMLKSAADQPEKQRDNHHRGFHTLAVLAEMKNGQRKSASKKKTLFSFFEVHILGIMAHFSEVLDNPHANHQLLERKRCVGAIGEMISLAGLCVSYALPQIRACLQSSMADTHLCDQTFLVWTILLTHLEEDDLELVIDQTFALIVQNWACFSDDTQSRANATLMDLVKKHDVLLRGRIDYIPSLASLPMMSKLNAELSRLKAKVDTITFFNTFSRRCNDENAVVVRQALIELVPFLEANQKLLHESAISRKPLPALPALSRSLLDACVRFSEDHADVPVLCAQCLGLIGGLDPYKVETVREKKHILVLSNFERANEVIDFTAFLLEGILVKVFHSTTNARAQGFLAYVMQELLKFCGFNQASIHRPRSSQPSPALKRWNDIPDAVRSTLTPFLSSRYMIQVRGAKDDEIQEYPIFKQGISHANWLRTFVYDLLQKGKGENARMIFPVLARIIRGHDLSIATFILPFAALNVIITGNEQETSDTGRELLQVLETEIVSNDHTQAARIKQCSENVFQTLDYLALWLQEKRKAVSDARTVAGKTGRGISEIDEIKDIQQISSVEQLLQLIPAEVISRRAVECGSYARALFHWEQYYRQELQKAVTRKESFAKDELLQHLQFIYAQIDEPDSIEGISAHLQILNPDQQIMEHRKAGRWTAAQSWYEITLAEKPADTETQVNLLTCLKESGQYDSILNYVDGFHASSSFSASTLPFAAEAAWSTGKWDQLERILASSSEKQTSTSLNFNVGVGRAMLALRHGERDEFKHMIQLLREAVAKGLSSTSTASLHACHDHLVKLHVLYEIEAISGMTVATPPERAVILANLDQRLDILGAYISDKQYLLGVRRAAMQLSRIDFTQLDIASVWLTTARLARKAEFTSTAFNSVLHAARLGDDASKIEYSKLMWREGHHRKAIQNLQGAIQSNAFQPRDAVSADISVNITMDQQQAASNNKVKCHAQLLLAKWLDRAGQTKALALKEAYASGIMSFPRWDKGHYYLGRHYLKLFESEKLLPPEKQTHSHAAGETAKLVIENYIRSVVYGTKHYYQTIPKVLTLWLDMGMDVLGPPVRASRGKEMHEHKINFLEQINSHITRYSKDRMPIFSWYTAFPQIITRISHPNEKVWVVLEYIIKKVAVAYPQQALWSLLAVTRATQDDRRARGVKVLNKLKADTTKRKNSTIELKSLIVQAQKLTDALLAACDAPVEQRTAHVSLSKDLGFSHKLAPCLLVVPVEATMIANLPGGNDSRAIRNHNPFPQDAITISAFMDEVLVLSSLQRPRKVNVRGSDGRSYGLLCKPKDDLRKDQRLMEFNGMINRALQQDIKSSKRRLYIKTYGVTPLNEECGTIEWVEGLKPMRDIIIRLYRQKNIPIDYGELRLLLNEACSDPAKINIFTSKILSKFPPVLYEWFIETFPEPEAWFAARLRYTRSCAVMSVVGHVLGLGDRHGENVLLEEGNGGTFHVDLNCLFDKGLTFEKPELVPFRLTHNMVNAMGPQETSGPFLKSCELTYSQLRQHEDTLITILETFVHDPTADFLGGKRKKRIPGVPETPQEVLEFVRMKVRGYMRGETVPLSVEGYVDALVGMARDPRNLAAMYIGWCAFF